jgi:hypothetical protein
VATVNDDETPDGTDGTDDAVTSNELSDDELLDGGVLDDGVLDEVNEPLERASEPMASDWLPPESTGVDAVDTAVGALRDLDGLPTAEHVARYEVVHRQLQDALADLDGS